MCEHEDEDVYEHVLYIGSLGCTFSSVHIFSFSIRFFSHFMLAFRSIGSLILSVLRPASLADICVRVTEHTWGHMLCVYVCVRAKKWWTKWMVKPRELELYVSLMIRWTAKRLNTETNAVNRNSVLHFPFCSVSYGCPLSPRSRLRRPVSPAIPAIYRTASLCTNEQMVLRYSNAVVCVFGVTAHVNKINKQKKKRFRRSLCMRSIWKFSLALSLFNFLSRSLFLHRFRIFVFAVDLAMIDRERERARVSAL